MLAALVIAVALQSGPGTETSVPVAELIGRSPAEVAAALGATPDPVPQDAVRIVQDGRTIDIYTARRFHRAAPQGQFCVTGFPQVVDPGGPQPTLRQTLARVEDGYVVFEAGRLTGVHPITPPPPLLESATRQSVRAMMQAPAPPSPFAVQPGRLPLSDGSSALERLPAAPDGLTFTSTCADLPERAAYRSDPGTDLAWGLVGLTLLPTVPFLRAEEARAEREGGGLMASVEPGADLPLSPEEFVRGRRGVRIYRDAADPTFALIAVKLDNGQDNVADVGLIGVRNSRVIWKAERHAADDLGLRGLVCRDAANAVSDDRRGCSSTGFLMP
jgi:hypothetical protein